MNKTQILRELKSDKTYNSTSIICGVSIATVKWDSKPWKVIHEGMSFDEVTESKEVIENCLGVKITVLKRLYKPIEEFKYQAELASYILKNS